MEEACRKTAARYGIEFDAALITNIDPPSDVDEALASINTTQNQVAAAISQARADAETKLKMAEQAVQNKRLLHLLEEGTRAQQQAEQLRAERDQARTQLDEATRENETLKTRLADAEGRLQKLETQAELNAPIEATSPTGDATRDLAAAGLGTLNAIIVPEIAGVGPGPDVRTDDVDGCPAFFARSVKGVTNGASPEWMARRLKAIGQKPISALVDITNYIMIDLGRPLHVYDMATLKGGLVARKGKAGEEVLALNGKTYAIDETMTVIADDEAVHDQARAVAEDVPVGRVDVGRASGGRLRAISATKNTRGKKDTCNNA
jgi:hypothetical protein